MALYMPETPHIPDEAALTAADTAAADTADTAAADTAADPYDPSDPSDPAAGPGEEYEFPVSDAQSRLLVLDQLNPGSAQYNVSAAFRVRGPFDLDAYRAALDALVERHESLRTAFRTGPDGVPVQIVSARARARLTVVRHVSAAHAAALVQEASTLPFDTARGPLLRSSVYAVDDGTHLLLLTAHHLVCDGWSLGVMLRDLSTAYADALRGRPGSAPEPALQFPDYAAHRSDQQAAGAYDRAVAHWADRLRGAPECVELPLDRPRPPVPTTRGGTERFLVSAATQRRLAEAARARSATPFMALLATYAAFVGRLSGQDDLVIGFPVSGRDRPELQDMVGMLTNTLALRVDLSGDPSFTTLTDRIRAGVLASQPYQDAPYEAVVDAVAPTRDTSHDPLVQVVFAYDDDTEITLRLADAEVERLHLGTDFAKFDLHLHVERWGEELAVQLIHRADILEPATVRRWARTFTTLMEAALDAPDLPLSHLDALPADERRHIVAQGDRLAAAAPPDRLVPDLIADQAALRPDATALVCGAVRLSYRELLDRADALAARLRAAGVAPGVRVGLLLPRSPHQGIAALAVLRAGGAYVPLDEAHPHSRLAHMTTTSGTALLLATAATADRAAALGVPVLRVDAPGAGAPSGAAAVPAAAPGPADLAYVLFTSGSTGVPKGVAVEHRALVNLTAAVRHAFPVTAEDRVLQFTSFGFDVAVSDLFFPWVAGAELHIAQEDDRLGEALLRRLRDSRITYVFLPPSAAMLLPDVRGLLPDLRTLAVGGEACPPELVERLWEPHRRIVNAYGPSEATVYATTADLTPGAPVVLGRPVPGVRVYVLDARLRPVPAGVTGEIYVAGASLGRGYIGRPELTAERFVPDPHGAPGTRMYRSGDLGRVDADGVIRYLGRCDSQVKLRGVRVELGEVETQLAAYPGVRHAAASVRGTGREQRLAAYVVSAPGAPAPDDHDLRVHLRERLPGYMVPEVFVHLDELPLNRSGKIERSRLPEPPAPAAAAPAAGLTPTQRRVAGVWADVLGGAAVGVHDNFFDLGGNSVRMLGVLTALREGGGAGDLTLVDLFRHPTVAALAARLDRAAAPASAPGAQGAATRRGTDRRARQTAVAHRLRSRKGSTR